MTFDEETRILISCGKDKSIKVYRLPEKWMDEELEKFEQNELKNQKDSVAMLKLQKQITKIVEDSDDDDLCGWDVY